MSKSREFDHTLFGIAVAILILIGVVLLWTTSSDQAPKPVANNYEGSNYEIRSERSINAACAGLQGASFAKCSIDIVQSERENHTAQKDLRAQRYMAIWAFVMAGAAIGTLLVTAVGLTWIKATLDETKSAVSAANRANDVMRAQQRPWLAMAVGKQPTKVLGKTFRSTPGRLTVAKAENKGTTPAWDVVATYIIFSSDTINPTTAGHFAQDIFLKNFDIYSLANNTVFQNDQTAIPITPLPKGFRTIGDGDAWSILVVCLYPWDDKVFQTWVMTDTFKPPENVLKRQKYKNLDHYLPPKRAWQE